MKIAVLHNYMDHIGGAEMVGLILARELKADIITTNIDHDKIAKMGFDHLTIHSIGRVPTNAPFRQQLASLRFRLQSFCDQYDFFIIDGDWAVSAAVNHRPNLWYVHSPIREIWDLYRYTRQNIVPNWGRWLFDGWVHWNRQANRRFVRNVDSIACNSRLTQDRVKKYLNRDAQVIYPPVDTQEFHHCSQGDYFLSVNRLITHKRVLMQIEAFRNLANENLIIVGCFENSQHFQRYYREVKKSLPANVSLMSFVSRKDLIDLYAHAKGLLCTSISEDFGLTAVEAMAAGKPVIASSCGGYRETILDQKTGILIDDMNQVNLVSAISRISSSYRDYAIECQVRARTFDTRVFIDHISNLVAKTAHAATNPLSAIASLRIDGCVPVD